jgi:hypothetical protein
VLRPKTLPYCSALFPHEILFDPLYPKIQILQGGSPDLRRHPRRWLPTGRGSPTRLLALPGNAMGPVPTDSGAYTSKSPTQQRFPRQFARKCSHTPTRHVSRRQEQAISRNLGAFRNVRYCRPSCFSDDPRWRDDIYPSKHRRKCILNTGYFLILHKSVSDWHG